MKVIVVGSKDWEDYPTLSRKMAVLMEDWVYENPEDKVLTIVHAGNRGAENMVTEFIGKVERLVKQNGYSIKEKVYSVKTFTGNNPVIARDSKMIEDGADRVLVFQRGECKRSQTLSKLSEAYGIKTEVVKTH
jgi:predicted proteasome-type protease